MTHEASIAIADRFLMLVGGLMVAAIVVAAGLCILVGG